MAGVIGWVVIIVTGLAWEANGLRRQHDAWPTLTDLIQRLPKWAIAAALGWLAWHLLGGGG